MEFDAEVSTWELIDPLSIKPRGTGHEELRGGAGKQIHFRQERYMVEGLLKDVKFLRPRLVTTRIEGHLVDFAITGAACVVQGEVPLSVGEIVEDANILIGEEELYKGRVKLVHSKECDGSCGVSGGTQLGFQLLDDAIDVERVFRIRSTAEMSASMHQVEAVRQHEMISPAYRRLLSEYLYLLTRYRSLMNAQEEQLGSVPPRARAALEIEVLEMAWDHLQNPLLELQDALDGLTGEHYFDREFQRIHQSYTMPLVTPHLATAPVLYHSWYKPLGYSGDHVLMTYIYERDWEGKSLFGRLMHRYGVEHPASAAVRARKQLIQDFIHETASSFTPTSERPAVQIMSLGSGPAREVVDFTKEYEGDTPVEITMIDQDNTALGFVNNALSPAILHGGNRVSARYLYVSFLQLLSDRALFESMPEVDLFYCAGLFDYLSTSKASALLVDIMSKVKSGGTVLVGNFGGLPKHAWVTTYTLDWNLRYRTEQEMQDLLHVLEGMIAEGEVISDATGLQYFIKVRKR